MSPDLHSVKFQTLTPSKARFAAAPNDKSEPKSERIPDKVSLSQDSLKAVCVITGKKLNSVGNATYLGGDFYLTAKHLLPKKNDQKLIRIGDGWLRSSCESGKKADVYAVDVNADLALLKLNQPDRGETPPISLSHLLGQVGTQAYLMGKKEGEYSTRVIPMQILNKPSGGWETFKNFLGFGWDSSKIPFQAVNSERYKNFDPRGLSGSPLVDRNGKLISVTSQAVLNPKGQFTGGVYGIAPDYIRRFLKKNGL